MLKNKVLEIRKAKNLSQEELAKAAGISRATLSKIETNVEAVITTETVSKLCKALECAPHDIFLE